MSFESLDEDYGTEPELSDAERPAIPVALLQCANGYTVALLLPLDEQTGKPQDAYRVSYPEFKRGIHVPRLYVRQLGDGNEEVGLARLCKEVTEDLEIDRLSFEPAGGVDPIWGQFILPRLESGLLQPTPQDEDDSSPVYDAYEEFLTQSRQEFGEY